MYYEWMVKCVFYQLAELLEDLTCDISFSSDHSSTSGVMRIPVAQAVHFNWKPAHLLRYHEHYLILCNILISDVLKQLMK